MRPLSWSLTIHRPGPLRHVVTCTACIGWQVKRWTYSGAVDVAHRHAAAHVRGASR